MARKTRPNTYQYIPYKEVPPSSPSAQGEVQATGVGPFPGGVLPYMCHVGM